MTSRQRDEDEQYRDDMRQLTQYCELGNPDDVQVNGQRFEFEAVRVYRSFASKDEIYPSSMGAEWRNVLWINHEDENIALTVPACFLDSAPMSSDRRQPTGVSWSDLMERELIDLAEKQGGWY